MMPNANKPYLISAITGNSRFLASLSHTGRIYRLWWPHIDYPQHVDAMRCGLRFAGEARTTWFDAEEDGWRHESAYAARSNLFQTLARSEQFPVVCETSQYAVPGRDIFVRNFSFTNHSARAVAFDFIHYSSMAIMENGLYNTTMFEHHHDALIHFRHAYFFCIGSANVCTKFQAGCAWETAENGALSGREIDMTPDGALAWSIAALSPGETVQISVYIAAGTNKFAALEQLDAAKAVAEKHWRDDAQAFWGTYLAQANPCPANDPEVRALYERSLLAMKLLADEETGSIIAAPEFDETFSRCGGYAYCWGRDAAFVTTALDKAGLTDLSTKFYTWAVSAQDSDGSWQQRHYHDGGLAPSWGIQLDEGGSILWGIWQHFLTLRQSEAHLPAQQRTAGGFLRGMWETVRRGADYLAKQIDADTGLPLPSHDLWEERRGEHTYSAAAVFGGLTAAAVAAAELSESALAAKWSIVAEQVRSAILTRCWNADRGAFYRGLKLSVSAEAYRLAREQQRLVAIVSGNKGYPNYILAHDLTIDISLIGVSLPFGVIEPAHPFAQQTADMIGQTLTAPEVGGIKRYEGDPYIGGNPWILTTLWLAQYRIMNGQFNEAKALIDWSLRHRTQFGLLPEQVDRQTGEPAWVVPLTWSHAMFILAVHLYAEKSGNAL